VSTEKVTEMEIFSKRLETLRKGRKKAAFASFLGTSPQNYGRYEQGRIPDAATLGVIANRCEVTVDWLLGRTDDPQPPASQDQPRIIGPPLQIGSGKTREVLEYRTVSREWLEAEVASMIELLPTAPEGRGRLALIRRMLEMLLELQERCTDVLTGRKRKMPDKQD